MNIVEKAWLYLLITILGSFLLVTVVAPQLLFARNINEYKDTITDSYPSAPSNHTLSFTLTTSINPGSFIEITPPAGFEILGTSTFSAERNVELLVNGIARDSAAVQSASDDQVEIQSGSPGLIRYTLNTTTGISAGSQLELKIGNNTSKSLTYAESYSTTTGTTTTPADVKPIINANDTGTHKVAVRIYDGGLVADADFSIAIIPRVGVGPADTRESIPPDRFNGAPTTTVTGVTLNVEIFLETNEFAICRYATVPDISYSAMTSPFTNTGLIYHTVVVPVVPDSLQSFYVRCIDDEGNFNIDDYLIEFFVSATPTGSSTVEGGEEGDGTGTGSEGTGDGEGTGGTTGSSDGDTPETGGDSGTGGSGGGGGGGGGGSSGSTAGGGFESTDGPYRSGDGRVTISGYTSPRSSVVALVDGKEAERVNSDNQGYYDITIDEIARGVYTFGIYAIDSANSRSSTFSTSFTVAGARTSALSNINLSPSLKVTPSQIDPGQTLTVSGYTRPNAVIAGENEKDGSVASRQQFSATADQNGFWSTSIPTTNFSVGTYKARVKATPTGGVSTNFSNYVLYGVGEAAAQPRNADLNRDGKVNLVDFSILLFWWSTDGGDSDPSADINADSRVNLVDFSILLFNWTG